MVHPVDEEFEGERMIFKQSDAMFLGLFEAACQSILEKIRVIDEEILVYDEALLLGTDEYGCKGGILCAIQGQLY